MAFRNRKIKFASCVGSPVIVLKDKIIKEDDVIKVVKEEVSLGDPDYAASLMPSAADYTLENILAAGLPLEDLNVASLLNPTSRDSVESIALDIMNNNPIKSDK